MMKRLLKKRFWFGLWLGIVQPIRYGLAKLDQRTNRLPSLIFRAVDRFTRYGTHEAAALSYYALFSLFPLLLLAIVGSASLLGEAAASDQVSDILKLFLPGDTAIILEDAVSAATQNRGSVSIFAIFVLGWSSANLFGNLEKVLVRAFGGVSKRRIYERRLVGAIMIIIFTIFLIGSFLTNVFFNFLDLLFLNRFTPWLRIASLIIPIGFNAAIFAMLYGFLPQNRLRWDAIWPASLIGGVGFELAKWAFVWYVTSIVSLNVIYGSVTTVIVFLLWAFVSFCIVILCAEICAAFDEWLHTDEETVQEDSLVLIGGQAYIHMLKSPPND